MSDNIVGNQPLNHIQGYAALKFQIAVTRMTGGILQVLGLPGIGKSAIFEEIAQWGDAVLPPDVEASEVSDGWTPDVFSIYVSQHDDVEFHMPFVHPSKGDYRLEPSPLLTRLTLGAYQIFDECTMEGCQRMMLQACSGKRMRLGGWTGPRGVTRIMIGNVAEAGNFSYVHNAVLGNRLREVVWVPLFNEWLMDFALPYGIHPLVAAAIKVEGQSLFLDYDATRTRNATPRSLTEVSDDLLAAEQYVGTTLSDSQRMDILAGRLHDEAALKIQSLFHLHDKLVPFSAIVAQPDTVQLPEHPAAMFMTCAAVARRTTPDTWPAVMAFVNRLPLETRGAIVEPVVKRHEALMSTTEFQSYAIDAAPLLVS